MLAARGLLPSALSTLRPELHDLPAPWLSLPTWNSHPITLESSITETQEFLRSDRATAEQVLNRAIGASNLIANRFLRAEGSRTRLTSSQYGQVTPEVIQQREEDLRKILMIAK